MQYEHELVQNIIDTYDQYGLEAVAATRWNLGGGRWERHIHSALPILEQWCANNDTHEVLTVFQDYMKNTKTMTQQARSAVLEGDFNLLEQLNEQRADVVSAVVFVAGIEQGRPDWMRWACEHVGEQWDNCFAQAFCMVAHSTNTDELKTVLGGWCKQCGYAHCRSHDVQWFLNSSHIGLLAQVLDQITKNTAYSILQDFTSLTSHKRTVLELMREHPIWDNTNLSIQTCVKRLVMQAARAGDVNSLQFLMGPNDRALSESEQKKLICVNREDITHALIMQCHNAKNLAHVAPAFLGLVDGDLLHNNPYLVDFLQQHQRAILTTTTSDAGTWVSKRKM